MYHQFLKHYEYEFNKYWEAITKQEVTKGNDVRNKFLTPRIRKFVWDTTKKLMHDSESIAGSACRIAEKYYSEQIKKYCKCTDVLHKKQFKQKLVYNFPLTVMCTIFIAAKLISRDARDLTTNSLVTHLHAYDYYATPKMLTTHEFEIMKALDFKLPLWNGLDTALVIALAASMRVLLMEVSHAMDIAEYKLPVINEQICKVAGSTTAICTTRLAASVVVAVAQKHSLNVDRILKLVANYSSLSIDYLKITKEIIVQYI